MRDVGSACCEPTDRATNLSSNLAVQASAPSEGEKVRALGRYSLIAQIGRGGMGVIYLGLVRGPAGFNKLFVVKELKSDLSADGEVVSLFLEEARLSARMNHPNVVQTIEVGSQDDHHFMAMEYLEGQSLVEIRDRCIEREIALPRHLALSILVGALEGLQYAHTLTDFDGSAQGVVHRDVSPHNLFVTFDGTVKVLDFGIAKATNSSRHTETGVLKGKVAYMSPEQAAGQPIDRRIDIFAIGVLLWEAVTGRRMWGEGATDMSILHALWNREVPDVGEGPDVPAALARIVRKATAADPNERYQTAAEMQKALEEYLATLTLGAFGARDIGKFVVGLFERDRAEIKMRIDAQVKLLAGAAQTEAGHIGMARVYAGATPVGTSVVQARALAPASTDETTAQRRLVPGSGDGAPRRANTLVFAAVAVGTLALGGGWVALHRAPAEKAAAFAPQTSGATVTPAPARSIQITFAATPPAAHIVIDGQAVAGNPFVGMFPADAAKHSVAAEAPGFEASRVDVLFDQDRAVNLALVAVAPQPTSPPSRSPSRATPSPAPSPSPRPTRKKDDLEPF